MDRLPGGPFRPEPSLCPPRMGNGHGGVMGGAAPILCRPRAWSARRPSALVRARPSAATPAGAGGWGRWGAPRAGPAAPPPPPRRGPFSGRGGVPSAPGGRRVGAPAVLKPGGERGGGGGGAAPPPRACHPSSLVRPPGVYSCRGGCRAAVGVGRGPVGRQWVIATGGGARGGVIPSPWFAPPPSPGRPLKETLRVRRPRRRRSAVGRQRVGRERAVGSPGALVAAAVLPKPVCSGLFGGGAGPLSLRPPSIRSWA